MSIQLRTFVCQNCRDLQSYKLDQNYYFQCNNCGCYYQVSNSKLTYRPDLGDGTGSSYQKNQQTSDPKHTTSNIYLQNNQQTSPPQQSKSTDYSWLIFVGALLLGGLIAIYSHITGHNDTPDKNYQPTITNEQRAKFQSPTNVESSSNYASKPDSTLITNSEKNQRGIATAPLAISHSQNIINANSIYVDSNFVPTLKITIKNPYGKPISNVEVILFSATDFDDQLRKKTIDQNIDVGQLQPNDHKDFELSANGGIETDKGIIVKALKIRFTDGTVLTY